MGLDEALAAAQKADRSNREALDSACRRFAQLATENGLSTSPRGGWTVGPIQVLEDGTWLHLREYNYQDDALVREVWEGLEKKLGKKLDQTPSVEFIEAEMVRILMEAAEPTPET